MEQRIFAELIKAGEQGLSVAELRGRVLGQLTVNDSSIPQTPVTTDQTQFDQVMRSLVRKGKLVFRNKGITVRTHLELLND